MEIKKPEFKIAKRKNRAESSGLDISQGVVFGAPVAAPQPAAFGAENVSDFFGVNVRNEAAGIKLLDKKAGGSWWTRELPHEIATALALMSFFAFVTASAGHPGTIPFCLVGAAVYLALVALGELTEARVRLLTAAGIAAALAVLIIVFRKFIGGGLGNIMNDVYTSSEAVQAYIYKRFPISEAAGSSPGMSMKAAAAWISCMTGALGAMPPAAVRRALGLGAAAFSFMAFAYYGLVPSAVIAAVMISVILFVLTRGGLLSALPVLLASMLLFGAVVLIDPGENYSISGADENMRDRLALRSAYLQSNIEQYSGTDIDEPDNNETEESEKPDEQERNHGWVAPLITVLLFVAAIAAAGYFFYRRYARRRSANREGIESEDVRTAIVSMFPYAVRWLGASGMNVSGKSFASLIEPLRSNVSEQYANYFLSMYVLWREAAYSDHEMKEEMRGAMKEFMNETREMAEKNMDWRGRIKAALKYAL